MPHCSRRQSSNVRHVHLDAHTQQTSARHSSTGSGKMGFSHAMHGTLKVAGKPLPHGLKVADSLVSRWTRSRWLRRDLVFGSSVHIVVTGTVPAGSAARWVQREGWVKLAYQRSNNPAQPEHHVQRPAWLG